MEFSREAARTMLLAAQGLVSPPEQATKDDVLDTIRRMGVLQIDSISVVAQPLPGAVEQAGFLRTALAG